MQMTIKLSICLGWKSGIMPYIVQLFIHIFDFFPRSKPLYVPQDGFNLEIGTPILCCKKKSEVHPVQKLNRWRHQVELKTKLWVQFSFGDSSESEQKQLVFSSTEQGFSFKSKITLVF